MAIIATKPNTENFAPIEEGSYPARIYQIIDLGTIPDYQGAMKHKVRITFELPTELKVFKEENGEQPQVLSQEYNLSFHEKSALRKLITACDPKALKTTDEGFIEEYDIEQLLGKTCLVGIKHTEGKENAVYANIDVATAMPKGMVCPPQFNESRVLSYDNFDTVYFETLPQFIKDKMKSSFEYKKMTEDPNEEPFPTVTKNEIESIDKDINLEDIPF